MRMLLTTFALVAVAGVAFAGEPQKQTTQPVVASVQKQATLHVPLKMTDQQLDKVVAGEVTPGYGTGTAGSAGGLTYPSGYPSGIETALNTGTGFGQASNIETGNPPPGHGVCTTNRSGGCPF